MGIISVFPCPCFFNVIDQRSANYGPVAKSGPPPVFINKVLLIHSHTLSFTYCLCCSHTVELTNCDRDHWPVRPEDGLCGPFPPECAAPAVMSVMCSSVLGGPRVPQTATKGGSLICGVFMLALIWAPEMS